MVLARCCSCKAKGHPIPNRTTVVAVYCPVCRAFYEICEVCGRAAGEPLIKGCQCEEEVKGYEIPGY